LVRRPNSPRRPLVAQLVGRGTEASRLKTLVSALGEGHGGTALIEGPAGIGKTRLIEYILPLASAAGAATAFGSADPLGTRRPFNAVLSIIRSLQADGPNSADQLTRYLEIVNDGVEPMAFIPPGSARVQVIETLIAELEQRTRTPLLLVVEDLHWADDASLSALRAAVRLRLG
jgi:predicted ATPase